MSSSLYLRDFIRERLTAAAEEIFTEFEKNITRYEERIRLLDTCWRPHIKLHRIDLPQQHVCMEDDVSAEQGICNQETNCSLNREDPGPLWIKQEEEEEFCSSQEEEEPELKEETNIYTLNPSYEEDLQQRVPTEGEALTDQLLCDQESNSSHDQMEPEPPLIKEEEEELCSSQEEERRVPQEVTNGFMPTPSSSAEGEDTESEQDPGFHPEPNRHQIQPHAFSLTPGVFYKGSDDWDPEERKNAEPKPEGRQFNNNMEFPPLSAADSQVDAFKKPFHCDLCGKIFQFKSRLIRHAATHMGKNTSSCGICKKSFSENRQLIHHMRIHTGERPCGIVLGQHSGLLAPKKEKPFVCNTCGKYFSKSYILKRHARLHTGEKPFTCGMCGKSFSRRDHMLGHMKTHSGGGASVRSGLGRPPVPSAPASKQVVVHSVKKPYSCEVCGKGFRRHRSFSFHMKSHGGVGSFDCKTCGKNFNQASKLKRHETVHTGAKPFSCGTCGKSLSRRDHLLRHMRLHAGGNPHV
ncbi:zinc finger protein 287 [Fundulus heteroclitus]|uniref:zinc finger protein 287 n=1 Tax=Fundulus heteroclitus TaxID=8078 RepID=UPI00165C4862|nr:zinc finger protein 287 [Fundulus heteroclitus]XP_036005944.1 zinc finger protein 287 [Fundulus heteroclitus]